MHPSALKLGEKFFFTYSSVQSSEMIVIDLGSQDILGSLREVCPSDFKYVGVDFQDGENVDLVLDNPYHLPFEDSSVDIIVCSSVFEHSQFFWKLFLEILRILKPNGLFYLNAPSNGFIHRYPVDCWRFYPDAGLALVDWGVENGFNPALLESFIANKNDAISDEGWWNDFVAIFIKDANQRTTFEKRMLHSFSEYSNAHCDDRRVASNSDFYPADYKLSKVLANESTEANETLKMRDTQISHLENALLEANETLKVRDTQISHLENIRTDLNNQINLIINSLSWRITSPFRFIKKIIK